MQGKVEIAGVNTANLKVLKNEETMELLRSFKSGDPKARQALIEGNLRLVLSVIQRFSNRGELADDLFQVAAWGSSRPLTILIFPSLSVFPPTAFP